MNKEKEKIKNILIDTIIFIKNYLVNEIITTTIYNNSIEKLEKLIKNIDIIEIDNLKKNLKEIFKICGTKNLADLLYILNFNCKKNKKLELLMDYFHPIKIAIHKSNNNKKNILSKLNIVDNDKILKISKNYECFNLGRTSKNFFVQVYGIKLILFNNETTIIIDGIIDDIPSSCIKKNIYILNHLKKINKINKTLNFNNFVNILTLKEYLIYSENEIENIFNKYTYLNTELKNNTIETNVISFINHNLYTKRNILISLLIDKETQESQYLAYLLYDLLSNEKENIDNNEQILIFNTLPWNIKKLFFNAMKKTLEYTKKINNFDELNISEEQRICLLKTNDYVKKKAMDKLKEIKSKSEDSATKPKKYLNGLLQIPFKIFKKEPVLYNIGYIKDKFDIIVKIIIDNNIDIPFDKKDKYNTFEIKKNILLIKKLYFKYINHNIFDDFINFIFLNSNKKKIIQNLKNINIILKQHNYNKITTSNKNIKTLKNNTIEYLKQFKNNLSIFKNIYNFDINKYYIIKNNIKNINKKFDEIKKYINNIDNILDNSIYGHRNAKKQIKKIIGEWINGDINGYSFGFEGPPGIGKTSLANEGITKCLIDENNNTRPFSLIAVGGSSNGSTFQGHNYTYVGSTWGKIVDILIESKCMNPIIFIDELDKISNSENGKEIIGILTHLIDSTQNSKYQDKYFSGIDLDMSKTLFIFSYNDPSKIDKILLDRIHRIKFKPLTLNEKIVISNDYIIPKILKGIGLENAITFNKNIIKFIISHYTLEPGVRKLKQIYSDIIREINIEILNNENNFNNYPIVLNKKQITNKYLKNTQENIYTKIHSENSIAIINGLWANSMGNGGIISIQGSWFFSQTFLDFKLTGMQGDVMKESMEVAKTLSFKLSKKNNKTIFKQFENKLQGIHIHCSDAATPKDGPSAGAAITTVIYSLLNKLKIKKNIAITGEININGDITMIGGLALKITGGIRAGVTHFFFPKENEKDYNKYCKHNTHKNIKFTLVSHIQEIFDKVFI